MAPNELRNRKASASSTNNKKKKDKGNDKSNAPTAARRAATTKATPPEPETLWETFMTHPLVTVAPYLIIPYMIYKALFLVMLRQPHVFTGLVELRPAVAMNETRQVLVLGAIGSGTQQTIEGLSKLLKLEVGPGLNTMEVRYPEGRKEGTNDFCRSPSCLVPVTITHVSLFSHDSNSPETEPSRVSWAFAMHQPRIAATACRP